MDIEDWYRRYSDSVYRRCVRLCRNEAQAWDLTQEVFLRVHRYQHSFRGESSPLTWLFTLADRCFFDSLRRVRPLPLDGLAAFVQEEREGFEGRFARHELVARLLSRCAPDLRAIVVHRYFDELDLQTIAERLGVNERTVRRKLDRFLARAAALAEGSR